MPTHVLTDITGKELHFTWKGLIQWADRKLYEAVSIAIGLALANTRVGTTCTVLLHDVQISQLTCPWAKLPDQIDCSSWAN